MAKDINVNSVEWCDLIFEGKNKDYGAYELRKHSPRRHLTAYVVIIGCVVLAMVLPAFGAPKANAAQSSSAINILTTFFI